MRGDQRIHEARRGLEAIYICYSRGVEYGELGPDYDSEFVSVNFVGTSNINVRDRLCLSGKLWSPIVEERKIYYKKNEYMRSYMRRRTY